LHDGFLYMLSGWWDTIYNTILNKLLHAIPEKGYRNDNNSYKSDSDEASTSSENNNMLKIVMMKLLFRMGLYYSK